MHKKKTETSSYKKQSVKQNQKSNNQKQISNVIKPTTSYNTPSKKVKINIPINKIIQKEENLSMEKDALFLHPNDSSENTDIMSVTSDTSIVDTFILKKE